MLNIILTSKNQIKIEAIKKIFINCDIITVKCDSCNLPGQAVNCAERCARIKLNFAKNLMFPKNFDYYISMENGVDGNDEDGWYDVYYTMIEHNGILVTSPGIIKYPISRDMIDILRLNTKNDILNLGIKGYNGTIDDIYELNANIDCKNWMKEKYGICRLEQIENSLKSALEKFKEKNVDIKYLLSKYRKYDDYSIIPQYNLFSTIQDAKDVGKLTKLLIDQYKYDTIDYIACIEDTGFYGYGLSCCGGYGYIPICRNISGLEIKDKIKKGSRILIVDDIISTGELIKSICETFEHIGCIIVDCLFLTQRYDLRSKAKKILNRSYTVILQD